MFNTRFMDRRFAPRSPEEGGGGSPPPPPAPVMNLPPPPQTALPAPAVTQAPVPPPVQHTDWKAEAIKARAEAEAARTQNQSTLNEVQQLRQSWEQDRVQSAYKIRQQELVAYRSQILAQMAHIPAAFHALVFGNDETELYNRAQAAVAEFNRSQAEIESRVRQQMAGPGNQPQSQGQPGIPPGFSPQGPPNPAMPNQGGFPSPAPHQGPGTNAPGVPLNQFATEGGVRSGKWGEVRDQVMNELRSGQSAPFTPPPAFAGYGVMPHTNMPGGVQQPNPGPTPQAYGQHTQNFNQWQQPQYGATQAQPQFPPPQAPQYPQQSFQPQNLPAPPRAQEQSDAQAQAQAAMAAADRTRAGQNPIMSQTGANGQAAYNQFAAASNQMGAHTGQTPQSAFNTRFNPNG